MRERFMSQIGMLHSWKRQPQPGDNAEKSPVTPGGGTVSSPPVTKATPTVLAKNPKGVASNSSTTTECKIICDNSYSPVCATNGFTTKTFINYCEYMKTERCCEKYKGK